MKEFENNCMTKLVVKGWQQINKVQFKHTGELFFTQLNIPIVIEGTNSKGKKVKKEMYYPATYCPFCGKKYYEE
jgi:hypothetical protein